MKNTHKISKYIIFILLSLFMFLNVYSTLAIIQPSNEFFINDSANLLDKNQQEEIMHIALDLYTQSKTQVVVLTVESLEGKSIREYGLEIAEAWELGDSQLDNGVLILIASEDRESSIEVGMGLEGALTDGRTGRIQDEYMIPHFKEGDYGSGIVEGYKAVASAVYQEYNLTPNNLNMQDYSTENSKVLDFITSNTFVVIVLIVILIVSFIINKINKLFPNRYRTTTRRHNDWNDWGNGSSGNGSSGGGYSGGGGSFGGGGSSRNW